MNKFTFSLGSLLFLAAALQAQQPEKKIDSSYNNTYYQGRMELFNTLPLQQKRYCIPGQFHYRTR
ncbi:hypothetical protein [Paraflavitalea speifideaquila]|uniref:hypothetical protein n=1 Tax=Paraflavitalea speifideaquila TaxID=3076558 RepID=UPI0028E6F89E|nr:hypothetical protein [Paraflavitalea speifideiaquila]